MVQESWATDPTNTPSKSIIVYRSLSEIGLFLIVYIDLTSGIRKRFYSI